MPPRRVATLLLLYPMVQERARNLANDAEWGRKNLAAHAAERQSLDAAVAAVKERGGRAYSGLAAAWGGKFKIGDVPFYAFFSKANVPAVAFLYHSMALTADIMVRFNEWNPSHYRLFNIRTVVAPAGADPVSAAVPACRSARRAASASSTRRATPTSTWWTSLASVKTTRNNFYDVNDRWLQSDWVIKRAHLRLDWRDDVSPRIARLAPEDALPPFPMLPSAGEVRSEQRNGEVYRAELEALRPCFALFKMTWHANWKAYVDGSPQATSMLTPGLRRRSARRRHATPSSCATSPRVGRPHSGFAGLFGVLLLIALERRGWLARVEAWTPAWASARLPRAAVC